MNTSVNLPRVSDDMDRFNHRCSDKECPSFGQRTRGFSCQCHVSREDMMLAEIASLNARLATAERERVEAAEARLATARSFAKVERDTLLKAAGMVRSQSERAPPSEAATIYGQVARALRSAAAAVNFTVKTDGSEGDK